MEQADGDMEIAEQDQAAQKQETESLPEVYKVIVDVFSDNNMFESNSEAVKEEIERLAI